MFASPHDNQQADGQLGAVDEVLTDPAAIRENATLLDLAAAGRNEMTEWSEGRDVGRPGWMRAGGPPSERTEGVQALPSVQPGLGQTSYPTDTPTLPGEARSDRMNPKSPGATTTNDSAAAAASSADWFDPVAARRLKFGEPFRAFADEFLPRDASVRRKRLYCSDDTFSRWCDGKALPTLDHFDEIVARELPVPGMPVPPDDRIAELRIGLAEAWTVPHVLRKRVEAAKVQFVEMIAVHARSAAQVNQQQELIASLQQRLAAAHGVAAAALRAHLKRANDDLRRALEQEHADGVALREFAIRLVEAVDAYLSLYTE